MDGTDAAAVARVRGGDDDGFRVLVERHSQHLFRLAFRLTGNEQDAEDVVQEAFLRAYRQLHRFEDRASLGTWLHRICANCAIDLIRSRPRGSRVDPADPTDAAELPAGRGADPEHLAASSEMQARISGALEGLTANERTAFVLRNFEGHSLVEIGRALGLRTSATKHSIFRAVQKMRRALEPLVSGEEPWNT